MLNFIKKGRAIAIINGNTTDKKIIYLDSNNKDGYNAIQLEKDLKFEHMPPILNSEVIYISGARGCGKSYFINMYLINYNKLHQKNKIFLFSQKKNDTSLDEKKIIRITIDNTIFSDPFDYTEFRNSLVIFDDIDQISDILIKKSMRHLIGELIHLGRDLNISVIVTNHDLTEGHATKSILGGCDCIVFFPQSGARHQIEYLAFKYGNLTKPDLIEIKRLNTRWAVCFRNYPACIMTEQKIFFPA